MGIHGPGDPGTRPTTFMTSSSRGSSPAVTLLHWMRARSTPPRLRRHGALRPVGAPVPLSGRYAIQGAQVRTGLELWADYAGVPLLLEDDESDPARAARLHAELSAHGCRFVLGPYGSDSTRVVAKAAPGSLLWNHGAAADDVQRLPAVVSVGSPASRYLIALGRAVAALRPSASLPAPARRSRGPRSRTAVRRTIRNCPHIQERPGERSPVQRRETAGMSAPGRSAVWRFLAAPCARDGSPRACACEHEARRAAARRARGDATLKGVAVGRAAARRDDGARIRPRPRAS